MQLEKHPYLRPRFNCHLISPIAPSETYGDTSIVVPPQYRAHSALGYVVRSGPDCKYGFDLTEQIMYRQSSTRHIVDREGHSYHVVSEGGLLIAWPEIDRDVWILLNDWVAIKIPTAPEKTPGGLWVPPSVQKTQNEIATTGEIVKIGVDVQDIERLTIGDYCYFPYQYSSVKAEVEGQPLVIIPQIEIHTVIHADH